MSHLPAVCKPQAFFSKPNNFELCSKNVRKNMSHFENRLNEKRE